MAWGTITCKSDSEAMKQRKILARPSQQNRKSGLFWHLEIITRGYSGSTFNAIHWQKQRGTKRLRDLTSQNWTWRKGIAPMPIRRESGIPHVSHLSCHTVYHMYTWKWLFGKPKRKRWSWIKDSYDRVQAKGLAGACSFSFAIVLSLGA
jgi:hypothetical protein